ncbi:glycerate kinase [Phaeosphaeriaceae sp. PMI808]|nr:glycerate kinase [Phaeosphaeriaceae sp. PMI808]
MPFPDSTVNSHIQSIPSIPPPQLRTSNTFSLVQGRLSSTLDPLSTTVPAPRSDILDNRPLRIQVAPSGFKESLGPEHVADAIEAGVHKVLDDKSAIIRKLPLHDGGEGFARALVVSQGGEMRDKLVTGPIGVPVESHLGFIGYNKKTAVLDTAAVVGLRLVPKAARDPAVTTTYALDSGATKIIIGCGDSGTSNGGAGMLQALGVRLPDAEGKELPRAAGGGSLLLLDRICWCNVHPRLGEDATVCNIINVLCGPKGVARVYGPQKGATPAQVDLLATALDHLAQTASTPIHQNISFVPGSGASGGLGAGLLMLGARLRARSEAIDEYFEFDRVFEKQWDLVITAEGSLDGQKVARRARRNGAQVVALAGTIGEGADAMYSAGIDAFTSILRGPLTLEEAIVQTENLVKDGAEKVLRIVMAGLALRRRHS